MAFQLQIEHLNPLRAPDSTERLTQLGVDPEYVISRDKKGNVISRFRDSTWDCRIYGATSTYNFHTWWDTKTRGSMDELAYNITHEIKTLFFLCMFETTANAGRSRGVRYLHQVMSVLRALAKMAHSLNIPLAQAQNEARFQVALRSSIVHAAQGFSFHYILLALLKDSAFWNEAPTIDYEVPRLVPEDDLYEVLLLLQKHYRASQDCREQYPLIPTRIFTEIIIGSKKHLIAVEPYLLGLEDFLKAVNVDPRLYANNPADYGNNVKRITALYPEKSFPNWSEAKKHCTSRSKTLEQFGLTTYFEQAGLTHFRSIDLHTTHLQILCIFLIHAYSGMRTSEVQVMPFEPIVNSTAKGFGDLPVLVSHLQKFSKSGNYSRPLVWATSEDGLYAVSIAQQLARLKWFRRNHATDAMPTNIPLFIGDGINNSDAHHHYELPIATAPFQSSSWREVCELLELVIEEEDLEELQTFDAFRAWDEDTNFAAGKIWPLSSHQFRRSVAVYASRSGMVSLPTLKTQFKHLSEVMTALYSENSSYAQNFLIDENGRPIDNGSVLTSFRDAVAFNTSVRFHEQVIKSESRLNGAIGMEIQRAKDNDTLPKMFESRELTEKAVKQGRLSYRETPVGGCVLKTSCPHFAVDLILPCTKGCKDAILKQEKLETYIESLRFDMEVLAPESRLYKMIAKEIDFVTHTYLQPLVEEV